MDTRMLRPRDSKRLLLRRGTDSSSCSSAAYQVEGATKTDGRGFCNWDRLLKNYPDNGNDACRSYELWKDDIALLKEYGARSYRFSVSWSRIIPEGRHGSPINEAGIKYYNNLVGSLHSPLPHIYNIQVPLTLMLRAFLD